MALLCTALLLRLRLAILASFGHFMLLWLHLDPHVKLLSQDAVGQILVVVVQLRRQRVQRVLHQLLDLALQLLLGEVHVKAVAQVADGGGAAVLEARQLGTCTLYVSYKLLYMPEL